MRSKRRCILKQEANKEDVYVQVWPDEDVEEFQDTVMEFFKACDTLSHRLLKLIAIGLKLQVKSYAQNLRNFIWKASNIFQFERFQSSFFTDCHNTFTKPTTTTLRLLHYPALSDNIGKHLYFVINRTHVLYIVS